MTRTQKDGKRDVRLYLLTGFVMILAFSFFVLGAPQGANINSATTEGTPNNPPSSRSDDGGTINVLTLDSTQQNNAWKAYVGNVSGRLTLDDANGNTIFDWSLVSTNIQGEVYVSRNDSISWTNITCANQTIINTEQTLMNMLTSDSDSINSTFNYTAHAQMQIGSVNIGNNTCRSTATFVNDSRQSVTNESKFQEILLQDDSSNLVYATFIEQDASSYQSTLNSTYDFQFIVAEDDTSPTPKTYYFYLEIS